MAYDDFEESVDLGRPFFLYKLDDGVTVQRMTTLTVDKSADPEATGTDQTWTASPVAHSEIRETGNIEKNDLNLTLPISDTIAKTYLSAKGNTTFLTVWRSHLDDPDEEYQVVAKERIVSGEPKGNTIVIKTESIFTSARFGGRRSRFQKSCRHALYFKGCNLNRADFETAATVSAIDGNTLTISEAADQVDGYYKSGIVNYGGLFGWIADHTGDQVTLTFPIVGLADDVTTNGSASVKIAPGCDRSLTTCIAKFDNGDNHGGYKWMPELNPYSTSVV